jgi:acetylornithine/succinyldiaminopimelate/putrescine aminotransferase
LEASLLLLILKRALDYLELLWWWKSACCKYAVLDVIKQNLMANASKVRNLFLEAIKVIPNHKVKGRGLMLGVEFDFDVSALERK